MKHTAAKIGLCFLVEVCVFVGMCYWWGESHLANPVVVLLMWPGVFLARLGATDAWILPATIVVALPLGAAVGFRKRPVWLQAACGAGLALTYCLLGILWFHALLNRPAAIPLPAENPYSADAGRAAEYESAYRNGYWTALAGVQVNYCRQPEVPASGHGLGHVEGAKVFRRLIDWNASFEQEVFILLAYPTTNTATTSLTPIVAPR